ncbi:16S rRNA (uracil(1498)-N(3))-methyltransferase [Virgibacillus salarius]|uniref:16S rRNA (uracil(1498)-N(3))-methyltransferase n=1 Tax=Virgibacillus salarius TaxID=447199 RepID=UPI0004219CE1|nr:MULTISPECIES: 16S rRNA (uracil(1498)-N(3))-methyltransferase [Bacillaceae]WBX79098.1 16S rRNA (uracil(1498)-N(3))-methyltransferase [Virgibacillus salarius]
MQRYFVPKGMWNEFTIKITGDDVHHMKRVMRFKAGDCIICNHPDGQAAICKITFLDNGVVYADIKEWLKQDAELPVEVAIAQGLPKGDKLDLIFQKGTELGANTFIPFQASRSVVRWDEKKQEKKLNRLVKIIKEASEQSHRNKLPNVQYSKSLKELMEFSDSYDMKLFAYEEEAKTSNYQSFGENLRKLKPRQRILICIGPEGGFSEDETIALKASGFQAVRLGPRILRTETAALYALASISYHFEELRCE